MNQIPNTLIKRPEHEASQAEHLRRRERPLAPLLSYSTTRIYRLTYIQMGGPLRARHIGAGGDDLGAIAKRVPAGFAIVSTLTH